ncbi:hypothetical protein SmJEL517_g05899 [Synchytrium microbalum]|uniref:Spc7 kinetochore protein domain-containing protein n=1 Tax=Synchytrium microbalum TaxID=1806994 RepID=A0A507BSA9_9FUNG|nr:uncharacterized protein SmJEL517_g05899 [Synchytrium microbalum]TPX30552.1 hypothetical protein SmJEL517_g05899 [Synchytrium microbalum]
MEIFSPVKSPGRKRRAAEAVTGSSSSSSSTLPGTTAGTKRRRSIMKMNANDGGSSTIPPLDDMLTMDSENDTPTTDETTRDKGKSRKSFGRRVSFAATAHVRLFDKEDSQWPTPSRTRSQIELPSAAPTPESKTTFDLPDLSSLRRTSDTFNLQLSLDTSQIQENAAESVSDEPETSFEVDVKGSNSPDNNVDGVKQQRILASPSPAGFILPKPKSPMPKSPLGKPSPSPKRNPVRRDSTSQFFDHPSPRSPKVPHHAVSQVNQDSPLSRRSPRLSQGGIGSPASPAVNKKVTLTAARKSPAKPDTKSRPRDSIAGFFGSAENEDDTFRDILGGRPSRPRDSLAPIFRKPSRAPVTSGAKARPRDSIAPFFQGLTEGGSDERDIASSAESVVSEPDEILDDDDDEEDEEGVAARRHSSEDSAADVLMPMDENSISPLVEVASASQELLKDAGADQDLLKEDQPERVESDEQSMIDLQEVSMDLNTSSEDLIAIINPLALNEDYEIPASDERDSEPSNTISSTSEQSDSQPSDSRPSGCERSKPELSEAQDLASPERPFQPASTEKGPQNEVEAEPETPKIARIDTGMTPLGKLASAIKSRARLTELTRQSDFNGMRGFADTTPLVFQKHKLEENFLRDPSLDTTRFSSLLARRGAIDDYSSNSQSTSTFSLPREVPPQVTSADESQLSLAAFLNVAGITFTEPSTTPARKRATHTTSRSFDLPRPDDLYVAEKFVKPEYELYSKVNEDLAQETSRLANVLQVIETEADENPPLLFADYQSGSTDEQASVRNDLHMTKQYTKLVTQEQFLNRRITDLNSLLPKITSSVETMREDQGRIVAFSEQVKEVTTKLTNEQQSLKDKCASISDRRQAQETSRLEALRKEWDECQTHRRQLEMALTLAQSTLESTKDELGSVTNELTETAQAIVEAQKKCEENRPVYAADLESLRDEFRLIRASSQWAPTRVTPTSITLVYHDKVTVGFTQTSGNMFNVSVTVEPPLDTVMELFKAALQNSPVQVQAKDFVNVLHSVSSVWDSSCALVHDLGEAQTVTKLEVLPAHDSSLLSLGMIIFSKKAQTRCRVHLAIQQPLEYPDGLIQHAVQIEYGSINEDKLKQVIARNFGPGRLSLICKELVRGIF